MNKSRVLSPFRARAGVCLVVTCTLALAAVPRALADTAPPNPSDPKTPVTVSADALPTAQIDGVGWQQVIIGNTVYVAGSFTKARPAGAAPGSQTVTRNNLLAYDLTTGVLKSGFAPSLNGQAFALAVSPDQSVLYVGGIFTTVNGTSANRIAAINPTTGALIPTFKASANASVRTIVARGSTVWFGGTFTTVNSTTRQRLAAVRASDGALLTWAPNASGRVNGLALSPDATKMVVGGAFTTLNGSGNPGYGLGAVNPISGASLPMPTNTLIRDAGADAAIRSLSSDSTAVYGTGYVFGAGGNLEGTFAANWSDLSLKWVEDCHGDTYGVVPTSNAVYVVGHPHTCRNIAGFPETSPRTWHRALAFSKAATLTVSRESSGSYYNFEGNPGPSLLNWFPDLDTGTYTGQNQGPWAVATNNQYVVLAGEFRHVNGTSQQGLVRFAISSIAPNKQGPRASGSDFVPTLTKQGSTQVKVAWTANWDRDNTNLTYRVYRDGAATPIRTVTQVSTFWQRPTLTYIDTPGKGTHSYKVSVTDPFGNVRTTATVSITL